MRRKLLCLFGFWFREHFIPCQVSYGMDRFCPLIFKRKMLSKDVGSLFLRSTIENPKILVLEPLENPRKVNLVRSAQVAECRVLSRLKHADSGLIVLVEIAFDIPTEDIRPELDSRQTLLPHGKFCRHDLCFGGRVRCTSLLGGYTSERKVSVLSN